VADTLSRSFSPNDSPTLLSALSTPIPAIIQHLKEFYFSHPTCAELITKYTTTENNSNTYEFKKGLLYLKGRLFVPDVADLRQKLIQEFHATPLSGHSSLKPTLARIAASFTWPGIYKDTKKFIQHCTTCQQNNYLTQKKKEAYYNPYQYRTKCGTN